MATINVISNSYLDEIAYTAGDLFTISSKATLTIRKSNTLSLGAITIQEGTLHVDSTAPGAVNPIVVKFASGTSGVSQGSMGLFKTTGQWHSLGTGNGNAGQTFTHIDSTAPPFVQVETGAGTGIYTTFMNIWTHPFSYVSSGLELGCFFRYDETTSTITFGDGINGAVVPNGANVRIPSILITALSAYTATYYNRNIIYNTGSSSCDISIASFSDRFYWNWNATSNYMRLNNVGFFAWARFSRSNTTDINGLFIASDRNVTGTSAVDLNTVRGTINNMISVGYNSAAGGVVGGYSDIIFQSCRFYQLNATSTRSGITIYSSSYCKAVTFKDCLLAGGKFRHNGADSYVIENLKYSDSLDGIINTTASGYAFQLQSTSKIFINGITVISGGTTFRETIFYCDSTKELKIINVDLGTTSNHNNFLTASTVGKITVARCHAGSPRTSIWSFADSSSNLMLANVTAGGTFTANNRIWGTNITAHGIATYTPMTVTYGYKDVHSIISYDSGLNPTTGAIQLVALEQNIKNYFQILAGTPVFDHAGYLYLRTTGDQVLFTYPDIFYGITGFRSVAPTTLNNTLTYEYQIKEPSANWPIDWKAITQANLTGETVSATLGFNLRVRITATSTNTNQWFSNITIPVNVDSTYMYVYESSSLQINSMVSGSIVKVQKVSDSSVIYSGTGSLINIPYEGDVLVTIRKSTGSPSYKEWVTITSLVSGETTTITALQELDE